MNEAMQKVILENIAERDGPLEDPCWMWLRAWDSDGYGAIQHEGRLIGAHRFAYMAFVGDIPAGLHVLHRCHDPCCVNPNHLKVGTNQENIDDKVAAGRQSRTGGDRTPDDVINEALQMIEEGFNDRIIAEHCGIGKGTVYRLRHGQHWKNRE